MTEGVYCSNCEYFNCDKIGNFICSIDGEILQQDYCNCASYKEYKEKENGKQPQ